MYVEATTKFLFFTRFNLINGGALVDRSFMGHEFQNIWIIFEIQCLSFNVTMVSYDYQEGIVK